MFMHLCYTEPLSILLVILTTKDSPGFAVAIKKHLFIIHCNIGSFILSRFRGSFIFPKAHTLGRDSVTQCKLCLVCARLQARSNDKRHSGKN